MGFPFVGSFRGSGYQVAFDVWRETRRRQLQRAVVLSVARNLAIELQYLSGIKIIVVIAIAVIIVLVSRIVITVNNNHRNSTRRKNRNNAIAMIGIVIIMILAIIVPGRVDGRGGDVSHVSSKNHVQMRS